MHRGGDLHFKEQYIYKKPAARAYRRFCISLQLHNGENKAESLSHVGLLIA